MARPRRARLAACIYCGKSLDDPELDSPSALGKRTRCHNRCYRKERWKAYKAKRALELAWKNVPQGCRKPPEHLATVRRNTRGGRKKYDRPGKYRTKQVCACGKSYIGGAAAVRCPICQAEHTRAKKRAYAAARKDKAAAAYARHRERRRFVAAWLCACMFWSQQQLAS